MMRSARPSWTLCTLAETLRDFTGVHNLCHDDVRCFSLKQVLARAWLEGTQVGVAACSLAVVLGRVAAGLEASICCTQRTFW